MPVTRAELEHLTREEATRQWGRVLRRDPPRPGVRQERFIAIEQVLAFAALLVVHPSSQGGSDWTRYHPVLQQIGTATRRSPASIANKGANLIGTRAHGQSHEQELYAALGSGDLPFGEIYLTVLRGARDAGIDARTLPDFLAMEGARDSWRALFIGDDELVGQDLEREAALLIELDGNAADQQTAARVLADIRIGQSRFARQVLDRFDHRCGFCGLNGRPLAGHRLTVASHIKPWRDSSGPERLDPANGVAACPTHDAAFDTGLLTVEDDLSIRRAGRLAAAASTDQSTATAFTVQPRLVLGSRRDVPGSAYLDWHRHHIWVNHVRD